MAARTTNRERRKVKRDRQRGRPPRLTRVFVANPVYFITLCTWQKAPLLTSRDVDNAFRQAAHDAGVHSISVGKYVIMPDHIHCFIRVGGEGRIGLAVKALKRAVTKVVHASHKDTRVWQEGFFDHVMRSAESYSDKWQYARANPVRAGLVKNVDEWPFQGEVENIRW